MAAVAFAIGSKGYLGLGTNNGNHLYDFWEYDPVTDSWTQKAFFPATSRYLPTGLSTTTKGYVGLGESTSTFKDLWEYDPASNSWTGKANLVGVSRLGAT